MIITLESICPHPLAGIQSEDASDIWHRELLWNKGEKILIHAPSGKGKTTLLMILYGIRNDYSGSVTFDQHPISRFSLDRWAEIRQKHISAVFQSLRLFGHLTARENLLLKAALSVAAADEEIECYSRTLGVEDCLDKECRFLSLGQQQRIAIIRALLQPFDWLLLDEPFSNLDAVNIERASGLLMQQVQKQSAGLIITSVADGYMLAYTKQYSLSLHHVNKLL